MILFIESIKELKEFIKTKAGKKAVFVDITGGEDLGEYVSPKKIKPGGFFIPTVELMDFINGTTSKSEYFLAYTRLISGYDRLYPLYLYMLGSRENLTVFVSTKKSSEEYLYPRFLRDIIRDFGVEKEACVTYKKYEKNGIEEISNEVYTRLEEEVHEIRSKAEEYYRMIGE